MYIFDNEVEMGMVKGFVHAIILPIVLTVIMYFIEKQYSIFAGIGYLLFAFVVYAVIYHTTEKHSGAEWFFRFTVVWIAIILVIGFLILFSTIG